MICSGFSAQEQFLQQARVCLRTPQIWDRRQERKEVFPFLGPTKEVLNAKPKVFPWCTPEAERQVLPPCEGFPSGETPTDSIDETLGPTQPG